jgi:phage recombination protein Bet
MNTPQTTTAIAVAQPRLPMPQGEADPRRWRVLTDAIFPKARSADSILLALDYCRARNLDVMKRPVNIVPMYDEQQKKWIETIWPSINETQITAARSHEWAGMDKPQWGPDVTRKFTDDRGGSYDVTFPEWCEVTVYRMVKGQKCAFVDGPVYWMEAYARTSVGVPNTMWRKRPRGQLQKVAKAASLRAAFPEENAGPSDDEMDGQTIFADAGIDPGAAPVPRADLPKIATPQTAAAPPADEQTMVEIIDDTTGEVTTIDITKPHRIEGRTWADFMEPMTAAILRCKDFAEYDEWMKLNQETLLKMKETKPELFQVFDKSISAKHAELSAGTKAT